MMQTTQPAIRRCKTALQRQRRILIGTAIGVALLAAVLVLVLFLTSRTPFYDPADGTKYYAAKQDGVYVLKTTKGEVLRTTEEGNFVTAMGTLVNVNKSTGACSTVAAVLIEDSEAVEFSSYYSEFTVLLYPFLERADIQSIRVVNEKDDFTMQQIEVKQNGTTGVKFVLENRPDVVVSDSTLFASLIYYTGKTRTMMRLDTTRVKELGYAEYGLPADGEAPTKYFTITSKAKEGVPAVTHTVIIGDEIPSGNGYYVRYQGRDAVYVLSEGEETDYTSTLSNALVTSTAESYVAPTSISQNMTSGNYHDVTDFKIYERGKEKPLVNFSYNGSIDKRNNTFYASVPYIAKGLMSGYTINSYRVDDCLYALYTWTPAFVVSLGDASTTEDVNAWLAEYQLDEASYAYRLTFSFNYNRSYDEKTDSDVIKKNEVEQHTVLVSPRQENGYFYVYSVCYVWDNETSSYTKLANGYNMVAAIGEEQLNFLFWDDTDWISDDLFSGNIAYMTEMKISIAKGDYAGVFPDGKELVLTTDNSETIRKLKESKDKEISAANLVVRDNHTNVIDTTQFKRFYQSLLYTAYNDYSSLSPEDRDAYIASGDAGAWMVITVTYELRRYNSETGGHELTGEVITRTYRFYHDYAYPRQVFTTVNGVGQFYTSRDRVAKIIKDVARLYTPNDPITYY